MPWDLHLLGSWQLRWKGTPQPVGARQQRLIASLALLGARSRSYLAGLLWPESTEQQAANSLRVTVFKIRHQLPGLLADIAEPLQLSDDVSIDLKRLHEAADAAMAGMEPTAGLIDLLYSAELLPGWYDDWLLFEQDRLRQVRIAALEALALHHLSQDRPEAAVAAAMSAAAIEPLRESAHALVIRGQVRAGNEAGARRTYEDFRRRLAAEMGLEPSTRLAQLVVAEPLESAGAQTAAGAAGRQRQPQKEPQ